MTNYRHQRNQTTTREMDKMSLHHPDGKTCLNCAHVKRCTALFGVKPTDTICDFSPSRFTPTK